MAQFSITWLGRSEWPCPRKMPKTARARYTMEFKQEAVRLVESGQSIAAAARTLGVAEQTSFNQLKA